MTPSVTLLCVGTLLWIIVIHFSLSSLNHLFFRFMVILALGAFFYWLELNRPVGISHTVMWVAPTVGLIVNLWGMTVKLDKRAVVSLLVGGLIIGLIALGANAKAATTDWTDQLPPIEQLRENSGLPGAPPISAEFMREIHGGR